MNWFTADLHFFHANIIRYANRPFKSLSDMDGYLISQWNERVRTDDTIYVIGDFVFGGKTHLQRATGALLGHKFIIRGNHEKGTQRYLDAGFEAMYEELELELQGKKYLLNHFPYDITDERFQARKPVDKGLWLLCGHVHDKWQTKGHMINVGVDCWNMAPVSEETIILLSSKGGTNK